MDRLFLLKRWSGILLRKKRWFWFYIVAWIWLAIFLVDYFVSLNNYMHSGIAYGIDSLDSFMWYLSLAACINVTAVPSLIILHDLRSNNFDLLRITSLKSSWILRSTFVFASLFGALPYIVIQLIPFGTYFIFNVHRMPPGLLHYSLLGIGFYMVGMVYAGLAFIGVSLFRKHVAAVIFAGLPAIFMFIAGALTWVMSNYYEAYWNSTIIHLTTIPFIFCPSDASLRVWFMIGAGDEASTFQFRTNLIYSSFIKPTTIGAILTWLIYWPIFVWRRNRG